MSNEPQRVALVGASGIGKHHAKWWQLEGAEVCAFAGTSAESVAKAEEGLRALFPFEGRAYTDVETMIARERPDIVDVCSPPAFHYAHVRLALAAGCRVLCEKPFVYRPDAPATDLMAQARELADTAESKGLRLGLCVQYLPGARLLRKFWGERFADAPVESFRMHLEVPARGRPADPARIWSDLGPHPLSALQAICPGGTIDWDALRVEAEGYRVSVRFPLQSATGDLVNCEIVVSNSVEPASHVREISLNGYPFQLDGVPDAEGVYCTQIRTPDETRRVPDFMRATIGAFLAGRPAAGEAEAVVNNEWLLRISELSGLRR